MNSALIGLVGVIAGALATGGIQLWLASSQRRNDALAAARITWAALAEVVQIIRASEKLGRWRNGLPSFERYIARSLTLWDEQRQVLARAVDSYGFRRLEIAFANLRTMQEELAQYGQTRASDGGFMLIVNDQDHQTTMHAFLEALEIAARTGQSRWDRVIEPRREKDFKGRETEWIRRHDDWMRTSGVDMDPRYPEGTTEFDDE
jgi:hypothetical protein